MYLSVNGGHMRYSLGYALQKVYKPMENIKKNELGIDRSSDYEWIVEKESEQRRKDERIKRNETLGETIVHLNLP